MGRMTSISTVQSTMPSIGSDSTYLNFSHLLIRRPSKKLPYPLALDTTPQQFWNQQEKIVNLLQNLKKQIIEKLSSESGQICKINIRINK